MQKIYAVTFKDENGKFTIQDQTNFSFSYDAPTPPAINPFGTFAHDLAYKYGGDDAVKALNALCAELKEQAVQRLITRCYDREEAERIVNRDHSYISWYVPYPTLDRVLPEGSFQMLPWKDAYWRENAAYYVREFPLPWPYEAIADHFAHLYFKENKATGKKEPLVRYFASPEHGMIRRATEMKPGRYLQKFYPSLDGDTVRHWATLIDAADTVRFATTPAEIKKVYQNGPRSCMAYEDERYESDIHPVEVYGDSDLQLAYLSYVDLDAPNFRASARVLVWPERKLYCRIYGDEQRMANALEKLGYTPGSMRGAKIRKVTQGDYLVMPYIDHVYTVTVNDDHCVIGGTTAADSTSGLIWLEDERAWCSGYEDYVDDDPEDFTYVSGIGNVSPSYRDEYCFQCAYDEEWYHNDYAIVMANGDTWAERNVNRHAFYCERTMEYYPDDEGVTLVDTDETVSRDWAENNAHLSDDGEWYAVAPSKDDEAQAA
ncbi:hypothetical protein GGR34_000728 [Microvirga flocculans]|uniref:Uncharacterized protein n=1 Tax=Microvirga flocculans TaxID=217168 RepID=A0A7W6N7A2_9HYPH|nr:hypothetical protein [Microvirga flocculans]MBB4039093.1 hypothetical protein [Microvirga flocculans]